MKQKLIFLDIDGTLLPPGEMLIPQSTVEALRKAHANGHKLFLCTGRNLRMTQPLLDYGFDGAVCSAGGYVFCGDKVLVDLPMEPQLAQGVRSASTVLWGISISPGGSRVPSISKKISFCFIRSSFLQ